MKTLNMKKNICISWYDQMWFCRISLDGNQSIEANKGLIDLSTETISFALVISC